MVLPLLAPLFGNLAASMIPSLGASVAGAVGAAGSMGPLVAAAAPKAIGAGIGSLLAGASTGDAATNALGFAAEALGPTGPTGPMQQPMQQPQMPPPQMGGGAQPMPGMGMTGAPGSMAGMPQPMQVPQQAGGALPSPFSAPGGSQMSAGIGSLPGVGGQPMPSVSQMIGSLGPNAPAAQQLMGQRGFY